MFQSLNEWLVENGISDFAIDVVLKTSLLFLAVAIACALLSRQSAALRHRLWCLAFVGSLIIAPCLLLMPKVSVAVLRASNTTPTNVVLRRSQRANVDLAIDRVATLPASATANPPMSLPVNASRQTVASSNHSPATDVPWVLLVWSLGVIAALSPLFLGWIASIRLRRAARQIESNESIWSEALDESKAKLNLKRKIRLYQAQQAVVPMTWGIFRPLVMLPTGIDQWSRSRIQMVLLHELAHIKRHDLPLQLMAQIACAVHWFNPLAWYALRRLRVEREQACDDCVVAAGERPSDYASELVNIAESHQAPRLTLSVGMANSSHLESRLKAMFDRARSHLPLTRRGSRWLTVTTLLIVTSVVVIQPVERAVMADENEDQGPIESKEPNKPKSTNESPSPESDVPIGPQPNGTWNVETKGNFKVIVLRPDGTPASGAMLLASIWTQDKEFKEKQKTSNNYECDHEGQFDIPLPRSLSLIRIWVQADGCIPLFSQWWPGKQDDGHVIPESFTYQLEPGVEIGGIVTDDQDQPLEGVSVNVELEGNVGVGARVRPIGPWHKSGWIKTDQSGRWSTNTVPDDSAVDVSVKLTHADFTDQIFSISARTVSLTELRSGAARMSLKGGAVIRGRVTDMDGNPIPEAVVVCGDNAYFQLGNTLDTKTDADGRYTFKPLDDDERNVTVIAKDYMPQMRSVDAKAGMSPVDFTMQPNGNQLRIKFVDATGKPIPKAWAHIERWRGVSSISNQPAVNNTAQGIPLRANKKGIYQWNWAPDGEIELEFSAVGFAEQKGTLSADGNEHTITLKPILLVAGTVTDAVTAQPIADFKAIPILYFRSDNLHLDVRNPIKGLNGKLDVEFDRADADHGLRIECVGYQTQEFGPWKIGDPNPQLDIKLTPEKPFGTTVVDAKGNPVKDANIFIAAGCEQLSIDGHDVENATRKAVTDAEGKFAIPRPIDDFLLVVTAESGYAEVDGKPDTDLTTIKLKRWASVDGRVTQAGEPVAAQRVWLSPIRPRLTGMPIVSDSFWTQTDDNGRFTFPRVPPVKCQVRPYLTIWKETLIQSAQSIPVDVQPGELVSVELNGTGREVKGQVVIQGRDDVDLHYSLNHLIARRGGIAPPKWLASRGFDHGDGWQERWDSFPASGSFQATLPNHMVKLTPSGHFAIHGVPPGEYDFQLKLYGNPDGGCLTDPIGTRLIKVVVPAEEGPLDIGRISVDSMRIVKPGEVVPDVKFRMLDGQEASLSDFRGKKVLIDCWATWCGPCIASIPELRAFAAKQDADEFVILGLSLDEDVKVASDFVGSHDMPWTHGVVEANDFAKTLGVSSVPAYFLIDEDGKLVARSGVFNRVIQP